MTEVTRSRRFAQSPGEIWAVLADFPAISQWVAAVDHSAAASTPATGAGAVRRVQVGRLALLERVVDWQPGAHHLAYEIDGLPPAAGTVTTRWRLAPSGATTHVTVSSTIQPAPGPPGRIAARLLRRRLAATAEAMLDGLAAHLDTRVEEPA